MSQQDDQQQQQQQGFLLSSTSSHEFWGSQKASEVLLRTLQHDNKEPDCLFISLTVKDKQIKALLDSGSTHNILSKKLASCLSCSPVQRDPLRIFLCNNEAVDTLRCVDVEFQMAQFNITQQFYILDVEFDMILGMEFLEKVNPKIDWKARTAQIKKPNGRWKQISFYNNQLPRFNPENDRILVLNEKNFMEEAKKSGSRTYLAYISVEPPPTTGRLNSLQNVTNDDDGKQTLIKIMKKKYPKVFAEPELPPHRGLYDHHVNLITEENQPRRQKIYPFPEYKRNEITRQVSELIDKGYISPSKSPFSSPVLLVKKSNGKMRMCIDYRKINENTVLDSYPMPRSDRVLENLGGMKFFSKIDLASAFHQIRVRKGDEWKTAFRTQDGLYNWTVMPFGMTNSPATFQRFIDKVFEKHKNKFVTPYMDDILVYSKTLDEHVTHLHQVFELLEANFLYTQPKKCDFLTQDTTFLGHRSTPNGLMMMPIKVEAMRSWPSPTNLKQLQSFLGLANYMRKFIPSFSRIAAPLYALMPKNTPYLWTQKHQAAFDDLKKSCAEEAILAYPDPTKPYFVFTDASDYALGGVLTQQDIHENHRPVAYHSRSLNAAEKTYSATEKETLAIVDCILTWSHYLEATHFTVKTDHRALQYLLTQRDFSNRRQERWVDKIQHYKFTIEYIKGTQNIVADALSRRPQLNSFQRSSYATSKLIPQVKEAIRNVKWASTQRSKIRRNVFNIKVFWKIYIVYGTYSLTQLMLMFIVINY